MSWNKVNGEKVRWGIIGAGNIARHAFAPAIRKASNGILLAVASRDADHARNLAVELGAEVAHGSYEALIADPRIDAVYIGLPNGLHEKWAIACAEAGKHVLCDKSLTLTSDSARRMVAKFADRKLLLVEAFMYRHHPQWAKVLEIRDSGVLGPVRRITAVLSGNLEDTGNHRWSAELGGGTMFDVTCYGINACRYLTGAEPLEVRAVGDFSTPEGVDRSTHVTMLFPGNVIATAEGSLASASYQQLVLHGMNGYVVVPKPFIPGHDEALVTLHLGDKVEEFRIPGADHYQRQVEQFGTLLMNPSGQLHPSEHGAENVRACEMALQSARG